MPYEFRWETPFRPYILFLFFLHFNRPPNSVSAISALFIRLWSRSRAISQTEPML